MESGWSRSRRLGGLEAGGWVVWWQEAGWSGGRRLGGLRGTMGWSAGDGAYPSWPAFSCEALCYIDGNCSSAFSIMATFAETTFEGPFGQCHQVPQKPTAPYTPFNDEKAFKPVEGVTRYLGVEGGSFFEAILRGFFGECAELHVLKHDALRRWVCGDRQAWSSAR
eukprot:m.840529 g.840529  ORF g.840529 m.840529 type:complete len:166 (-) comp23469_c0_seq48:592-1089(-)